MANSTHDRNGSPESTYFSDIANPQRRTVVKDRRNEISSDKFSTDVDRFMRRVLDRVKQAIQDDITEGNLNDIGKDRIKVPIPKELTREPYLHHTGMGKRFRRVFPGNKGQMPSFSAFGGFSSIFPGNVAFDVGDKIPIPKGGGGGGGKGGGNKPGSGEPSDEDSEAEDDFIWVNEADYLDILFDGRQLPDMTKLKSKDTVITQLKEAGQITQGPFNRLNMPVTDRNRREEELTLSKGSERRVFQTLAKQFNILAPAGKLKGIDVVGAIPEERNEEILSISTHVLGPEKTAGIDIENSGKVAEIFQSAIESLRKTHEPDISADDKDELDTLEMFLDEQRKRGLKIGRFRDEHLRYNFDKPKPKPNAKAVMFCLMDVSGSMGQEEKNTAKVFFWLLKKFLDANYKQVDLVFIAHTTQAKEVDEKEFFYGTETGGTIVSTCLQKTLDILKERYPVDEWNIYSAQASDGDNSYSDNEMIVKKMEELLPMLQAHYYLEVASSWRGRRPSSMYEVYDKLSKATNGKIQAAWGIRGAPGALDAFKRFFPAGGAKPSAQAELGL